MSAESDPLRFDTAMATDTGRVRTHNEDNSVTLPHVGLWAVADGMGGHAAGDVASSIIADELGSVGVPVSADDLRARVGQRLDRANARIQSIAEQRGGATIGSTVVALLIHEHECFCVWAGDSRIYLLRQGRLTRLTTDHSEVQEMLDAGNISADEARNWPRRNVITRAIGIDGQVKTQAVAGVAQANDVFLLCSDGLTEHVGDDELASLLGRQGAHRTAEALVALTLERGARDNVTVVVVGCHDRTLRE